MKIIRNHWGLLLILLAGAFFRVWQIGLASYQIDELATMQMWQGDHSVADVFAHGLRDLNWAHRMVMLPLINMFIMEGGHYPPGALPPEWLGRIPHAIFGIFSLPIFWLLGRAYQGRGAAWWSMLLAAFSVFGVYYAREAYDYSVLIFFSAAVAWTGLEVLQRRLADGPTPWLYVLFFILSSTGLLLSHLSGLLFLGCWMLALAAGVLVSRGQAVFKQPREWGFWAIVFLPCFVLFAPFLRQLMGGFTSTDTGATAQRFSLSTIPAIFGRLGWGESLPTLILFAAAMVAGVVLHRRNSSAKTNTARQHWLIVGTIILYFALQSWTLRVARLETRYYAPFFPLLLLLAAAGLDSVAGLLPGVRRPWLKPATARALLAIPLLAWLLPSLWAVTQLRTRGYNYKGIAEWLTTRLPEHGVYAFYNVYEMRGVPHTYPTPGRDATAVASWSTQQDFDRVNPPERARSLFTRFPQIVFVEIAPEDLLAEKIGAPPIDRDGLFMRHEWIEDPAADFLFRWKTHPTGEVQWMNHAIHRVLLSYNLPDDLPALARKHGQEFYHRFGTGWRYTNDQGYNHWMALQDKGNIVIGNISSNSLSAEIRVKLFSPNPGCRVHISDARDKHIASFDIGNRNISDVELPAQSLPPGETTLNFRVAAGTAGAPPSVALIYSIEVKKAPKSAP